MRLILPILLTTLTIVASRGAAITGYDGFSQWGAAHCDEGSQNTPQDCCKAPTLPSWGLDLSLPDTSACFGPEQGSFKYSLVPADKDHSQPKSPAVLPILIPSGNRSDALVIPVPACAGDAKGRTLELDVKWPTLRQMVARHKYETFSLAFVDLPEFRPKDQPVGAVPLLTRTPKTGGFWIPTTTCDDLAKDICTGKVPKPQEANDFYQHALSRCKK